MDWSSNGTNEFRCFSTCGHLFIGRCPPLFCQRCFADMEWEKKLLRTREREQKMCVFDDNEYWAAVEMELEHDRQEAEADAKNGYWTRKDGSKIHVSEMSTDYIKNCIGYINRTDVCDVMLPLSEMLKKELKRRKDGR